ncbi:hypothetical protein BGZ79_000419, partial [Entomortierella chlamydospora]
MDSTGSQASSALQEDVDILRRELQALEAKREALLQQIEQEERVMSEETAALAPAPTAKADKDQRKMQDILTAYRLTGVTMFNASEFEESDWSKYNMPDFPIGPKEIGIRFETFANGMYHEPYYIMITGQATSQTDDDQEDQDNRTENGSVLKISKHTIPHWIPLRDIEKRHLNRDMSVGPTYSLQQSDMAS